MQPRCKPQIDGADYHCQFAKIRRQDCKLEAVKLARRGTLNLTPSSFVLLFYCLTVMQPLAATSLFDPQRGVRDQVGLAADDHAEVTGRPGESSGSAMLGLRLEGILTLGEQSRVMISGPEGETYRFGWEGTLGQPMAFEGKSADRLAGYQLHSSDSRSVWLQLPVGTGCEPDLEKGIVACEEGRAKLVPGRPSNATATPPPIAVKSERKNLIQPNAKENAVQQSATRRGAGREMDPDLARWREMRRAQRQARQAEIARIRGDQLKYSDQESGLIQMEEAARRANEDKPPGL